jgi:hypothetical protein
MIERSKELILRPPPRWPSAIHNGHEDHVVSAGIEGLHHRHILKTSQQPSLASK